LVAVARRLQTYTRSTDLVARFGGDEFVIVQADAQQPSDATTLSQRLTEALHAPYEIQGQQIIIGVSVGIALADDSTISTDTLLRNADLALYRAKAAGRGTWRFFEHGMDTQAQAQRTLEADLRRAFLEQQFKTFYQPLIDTKTKRLVGFEALLRWKHPERGMIPPAEFIPVAEENGLIKSLGVWVLHTACADATQWPAHIKIAVNLSPVQFFKGNNLVEEVERALAQSGLAADRLELEVTESVLLQDDDATLVTLHRLRRLGAHISMDDFGTGYSSLSYLRRFPFSKIKIDQSFIRNIQQEKSGVEIVRAIIQLGKALDMRVLAEGVETPEQLALLQDEGCDELQGYLFSQPKPLQDVRDVIARYSAAPAKPAQELRLIAGYSGGK
jgi:predicted signal transduction protein with EAL and GGDEF domain